MWSGSTRQLYSLFCVAFHQQPVPPLSLSPYLTGLINHSAGHWKLCRLTSPLLTLRLCRSDQVMCAELRQTGEVYQRSEAASSQLLSWLWLKQGRQLRDYLQILDEGLKTFSPQSGKELGYLCVSPLCQQADMLTILRTWRCKSFRCVWCLSAVLLTLVHGNNFSQQVQEWPPCQPGRLSWPHTMIS